MNPRLVRGERKGMLDGAPGGKAERRADRFPHAVDVQLHVLLLWNHCGVHDLDGGLKRCTGHRRGAVQSDRLEGCVGRWITLHIDQNNGHLRGATAFLGLIPRRLLLETVPGKALVVREDINFLAVDLGLGQQGAGLLDLGGEVSTLVAGPALSPEPAARSPGYGKAVPARAREGRRF